jgi:hypothetical protein
MTATGGQKQHQQESQTTRQWKPHGMISKAAEFYLPHHAFAREQRNFIAAQWRNAMARAKISFARHNRLKL